MRSLLELICQARSDLQRKDHSLAQTFFEKRTRLPDYPSLWQPDWSFWTGSTPLESFCLHCMRLRLEAEAVALPSVK